MDFKGTNKPDTLSLFSPRREETDGVDFKGTNKPDTLSLFSPRREETGGVDFLLGRIRSWITQGPGRSSNLQP